MTRHLVALKAITILPNRQRREFDPAALNDLADSIERIGLLQPPVVRMLDGRYVLVAGERRLRAMQDLHDLGRPFRHAGDLVQAPLIPVTPIGELSPIDAMEAELEENIRRVDLTWQERAFATAKLADLRAHQARALDLPLPTTADISEEVRGSRMGVNQETTRRELILAKHLHDPDVKAAKSVDDAFKVLKRKEEAAKSADLARSVGETYTANSAHTLLNCDSLEWMSRADPGQFDVILTDPPYGMGADEFGDSGGVTPGAHTYADTADVARECYEALAFHGFRITKPEAHLYAFCDVTYFNGLFEMFTLAGWRVFRTPLIWHKPAAFRAPWPEHGPQRKYETLLYAVKGNRRCLRLAPDVLTYPPDENLGHSAQKPVALFDDLLRRSVRPGDKVLDPFCGSGPIFPAAHALKLFSVGIERDPVHYGQSLKRIQSLGGSNA